MSDKRKQEVITFKVDEALSAALAGIPNRSEFIRSALVSALGGMCPLCRGSGTLTPEQQRHWQEFAAGDSVGLCDDCHAIHLVCEQIPETHSHAAAREGVRGAAVATEGPTGHAT